MKKSYWYWLLPLLIFAIHLLYTFNMLNHIRQEELTESVSNVYWFSKGNVCSGLTSNVGWYSQLLLFYNLFGFSLVTIKIYKLVLVLISLFALAGILKRFLGDKLAGFPLLTIGLSPTFMYFNSLSTHYGIDLLYFPILFYLLLQIKFNGSGFDLVKQSLRSDDLKQVLFWGLTMFTWLSYPSMIYYLPFFAGFFGYKLLSSRKRKGKLPIKTLAINLAAFLTPLALSFLYVKQKNLLIYDGATGTGLFRGNGVVSFDPGIIWNNLQTLFSDLFLASSSYYFELIKVEFSDVYPGLTVAAVFLIGVYMYLKKKNWRRILLALTLYLVLNILLSALAGPLGGIRRSGIILVVFYTFLCFSWYFLMTQKKLNSYFKFGSIAILLLLLIHHLLAFPKNLEYLKNPSNYREGAWFYQAVTPQKSLDQYLDQVTKNDLSLICLDEKGNPVKCQRFGYNLIYPAVAGACLWNGLNCHQVKYFNFETGQVEPLTMDCWDDSL